MHTASKKIESKFYRNMNNAVCILKYLPVIFLLDTVSFNDDDDDDDI